MKDKSLSMGLAKLMKAVYVDAPSGAYKRGRSKK